MATQGQPPTEMNPNAERLLVTAAATFEAMKVVPDPGVKEVVKGLAETAAKTLQEEGRATDDESIRAAQARLAYVLIAAGFRTERQELTLDYIQAFPNRQTALDASTFTKFLDGICPLWPFCT